MKLKLKPDLPNPFHKTMTALLYRSPDGWQLMLAFSDVRGSFASTASARRYARTEGIKVKRSPKLDS